MISLFCSFVKILNRLLNGHCMVSLMISVPVMTGSKLRYISIPVGYRMWTKEETKLKMAADLVKLAMKEIGEDRNVILCCDSWYPKAEIVKLPDEFENLNLICNVRSDTALYDLPPARTGKKGRPRIRGERITLQDFSLKEVRGKEMSVGTRTVITNLFGKRQVTAIATQTKCGNNRLFLCTASAEQLHFDTECMDIRKAPYSKTDSSFLPLTIYALRWNIETSYYQQNKFWSLEKYMLRSKDGIECLLNLLTLVYSLMTLLPFLDSYFSFLTDVSPQQAWFLLSCQIHQDLFFAAFVQRLKYTKNTLDASETSNIRFVAS